MAADQETPSEAELSELVEAARSVRERAHAPYSKYKVGAALRATDGRIFLGVNVENSAYPTCLCAEHNALGSAVAAGASSFSAAAVVTELNAQGEPGSPCGQCRQALSEFGLGLVVALAGPTGAPTIVTLGELLPRAFRPEDL